MDPTAIAVFTLAASVFIHSVAWLFKTPKEVNGELTAQIAGVRLDVQEQSEQTARHDERISALILSLDRLTARLDRLEPYLKPANGRRGN